MPKSIFERRPLMVAIAGPNGAGKSTFYESYLSRTGFLFVNADVIAAATGLDAYAAAALADSYRRRLVAQGESFIFETVFSDPKGSKLSFLVETQKAGYKALLIFIGVSGEAQSATRVSMRAAQGGHDVPARKIQERYGRTMENLRRAFLVLSNIQVYDNSDLARPYRLVARLEEGDLQLTLPTPKWLKPLLPRPPSSP